MGKEKQQRKKRLDKVGGLGGTGTAEFIGFSAFANAAAPSTNTDGTGNEDGPSADATGGAEAGSTSSFQQQQNHQFSFSPVYTGGDGELHLIFGRLGKRDATTRVRALQELARYFSPPPPSPAAGGGSGAGAAGASGGGPTAPAPNKRTQAEAMAHYAWLDSRRLQYDPNSAARAASLMVWTAAIQRLPRAFGNLLLQTKQQQELAGRLFAGRVDPAADVRQQAEVLWEVVQRQQQLQQAAATPPQQQPDGASSTTSTSTGSWIVSPALWNEGVWLYANRILSYGRPSNFYQDVFGGGGSSSSKSNKKVSSGSGGSNAWSDLNDAQRDAHEETFERMVGLCLSAMEVWMREAFDRQGPGGDSNDIYAATVPETVLPESVDIPLSTRLWWKTLKSNKASLRRKTYQLLSTTALRRPAWIFVSDKNDAVLQTLQLVLLSEKEGANLPTLLETILTVLVAQQQMETKASSISTRTAADNDNDNNVVTADDPSPSLLQKPLVKLLKRACYGARVGAWGPTLLPLTATVAFANDPLPLLQAAWEGRTACLGQDSWLLLSAVVECAAFALLRRRGGDQTGGTLSNARAVAQVWLDVFEEALSKAPPPVSLQSTTANARSNIPAAVAATFTKTTSSYNPPHVQLLDELSKSLAQFQLATHSHRANCAWNGDVETWFWGHDSSVGSGENATATATTGGGLTLPWPQSHPLAVAHVLRALQQQQPDGSSTEETEDAAAVRSLLVPKVKAYFVQDRSQYQTSSGAVPSLESYQLYQDVFAYCGSLAVVDDLDNFVMNDLLRWIVIHTSTLSTQTQSRTLVRYDFGLLSSTLSAIIGNEKRQTLWEAILREVIQAQCDLKWLVEGVRVLMQQVSGKEDPRLWIRCPTLDQFALDVGLSRYPPAPATEEERNSPVQGESTDEEEIKSDRERLAFLRLCLGIQHRDTSSSAMLVSRNVLTEWIDSECPVIPPSALEQNNAPTFLLEALLEVVRSQRPILESIDLDRILFTSWYRGGEPYANETLKVLSRDQPLSLRFISSVSGFLCQQLDSLYAKTQQHPSVAAALSKTWSHRAWRLIHASKCPETEDRSVQPSLKLVGLAETKRWSTNPDLLYLCTMSLIEQEESISDRQALLLNSGDDAAELMVSILLNISEASTDAARAARAKSRHDRCASFLNAVGGRELTFAEQLVRSVIRVLSGADEDERTMQRGVAVLSQLVGILFHPIAAPNMGKIEASMVIEGSQLWYITDPENQSAREPVEVEKVHYDAQTGYFFAIRLNRSGETQERQTVIERLRQDPREEPSTHGVPAEAITADERLKRAEIRDLIVTEVINRHFFSWWTTMVAELVNVVGCAVGLGQERGTGSVRYDIFQRLKSTQDKCINALNSEDIPTATDALWTLSLALGYGFNTPSSSWMVKEFPIEPLLTFSALLEFYDRGGKNSDLELNCSILAWLSTSIGYAANNSSDAGDSEQTIISRMLTLLFDLGKDFFENETQGGFSGKHLIVCRAIYDGYRLLSTYSASDEQPKIAAGEVAVRLVKNFACRWEDVVTVNEFGLPASDWTLYSNFSDITRLSQTSTTIQEILNGANEPDCVEALSNSLFVVSKRHDALRLLYAFTSTGIPVFNGVALQEETKRRLKEWTEELEDEEAEEVEEDIEIVGRWLPRRMMIEVEDWGLGVYEETDEPTTVGRLLTWMCVLQTVDVVAPKDFRYRPAFLSYLIQCGAADAALNLALLNDECINVAQGKMVPSLLRVEALLKDVGLVELSKLSSLVLFQTVEVLPSLSRRWWEDSCPKVYISDVQNFVEKYVAPEIFKRELGRIQSDTACSFGNMSVRSSSVSREVTASYVQDEFTLSVRIMVPPLFPLRSAEVDCSKTLGVPPQRWKRWSLQITQMLNNQGGTLQDALLLWKDNVDQEFEGVEPCPVCYSVLHVKTHKLPTLECKTCQNRFHFDCLTQWFRSSGKTQCVLCQQPWHGTRVQ